MEAEFLVEKGTDMPISHSQAGQTYPAFRQIGNRGVGRILDGGEPL